MFGRAPIDEEKLELEKAEIEKVNAVDIIKDNVSIFETQEEFKKPTYKFIGIVFKTYIILEIDKEMYILDQGDSSDAEHKRR